jgi:collagenase-like PrtC family protease
MEPLPTPRLSLGPVLYYWSKETILDFYDLIASTPVDIVYLGETVCSKRRSLRTSEWIELAQHLTQQGKQVVLSSLSLIEAESELKSLRRLCEQGNFMVEANDMGAIQLLASSSPRIPFAAGPTVNIYNANTLRFLHTQGLQRWVMPVELSRDTLHDIQQQRPTDVETEIFSFGRMPLSIAARCFTARAHDLPKDDCQLRCLDDPNGITLRTQDDQPFLTLNGVQTQSAQTYNLLTELDDMRQLKVDILRISPQSHFTDKIILTFHECLQGNLSPTDASQQLEKWMTTGPCNGYWHNQPGMEQHMKEVDASLQYMQTP